MTSKTFQLEPVSCPSCVAKIEGMLGKTRGVEFAEVLFNSSRVRVQFDDTLVTSEELRDSIVRLGYPVKEDGK